MTIHLPTLAFTLALLATVSPLVAAFAIRATLYIGGNWPRS